MATNTYQLLITTAHDLGPCDITAGKRPFQNLEGFAKFLNGVANGSRGNTTVDLQKIGANATGTAASGTVTITGGSGTETATINGVAINATWATSDNNTASLLAAAINASVNALVAGFVVATAATNVVTIKAATPGLIGNAITLAASGTGAVASGARLAGGTANSNAIVF